jgi:hypothetical protein
MLVMLVFLVDSFYSFESFDFLNNPQMEPFQRFFLKTANNEYVTVCGECEPNSQNLKNLCKSLLCLKKYPTRASVFIYHPHRDGTFSVQSELSGLFWKRCNNCVNLCPNVICGDGINKNLQASKFVLIKTPGHAGDSVEIKTDLGRVLELTECNQQCGRVLASLGVGLNKQFFIEKLPNRHQQSPIIPDTPITIVNQPFYAPINIPYTGG